MCYQILTRVGLSRMLTWLCFNCLLNRLTSCFWNCLSSIYRRSEFCLDGALFIASAVSCVISSVELERSVRFSMNKKVTVNQYLHQCGGYQTFTVYDDQIQYYTIGSFFATFTNTVSTFNGNVTSCRWLLCIVVSSLYWSLSWSWAEDQSIAGYDVYRCGSSGIVNFGLWYMYFSSRSLLHVDVGIVSLVSFATTIGGSASGWSCTSR